MIKDDLIKPIKLLSRSTGRYVASRIYDSQNKALYVQGIKDCFLLMERCDNLAELKDSLSKLYANAVFLREARPFSVVDERKYYRKAISHVQDIQDSLERRFASNGSIPDPRLPDEHGIVLREDENLFGDTYES